MLEHQKTVLKGVSNNKQLFKKELVKSLGWLNNSELTVFIKWVNDNYYNLHGDVINEVFEVDSVTKLR